MAYRAGRRYPSGVDHLWSTLDPSHLWDAYADWLGGYFTSSIPGSAAIALLATAYVTQFALVIVGGGRIGARRKAARNLSFRDGHLIATTPRRAILVALGISILPAAATIDAVMSGVYGSGDGALDVRVGFATAFAVTTLFWWAAGSVVLWRPNSIRIGSDGVALKSVFRQRLVPWPVIETDAEALYEAGLRGISPRRPRRRQGALVNARQLDVSVQTLVGAINYYRDRPDLRAQMTPVGPNADVSVGELYRIG